MGRPRKSTDSERSAYQRRYYRTHREQAIEYQRVYNANRRSGQGRRKPVYFCPREAVQSMYTQSDLINAPVEKAVRMLEKILSGERGITM